MSQNHEHSDWEAIVLAARERASARQASMAERFGLAGDARYHWSMDEARITWSRGGTAFLSGQITMIGSVSVPQQTWLWSWANPSLPALVLGKVDQVRRYGEANDFPVLPWKSFNYHPDLVTEARVVAASVLDAEGLWFDDLGDVQLHFLVHDLTLLDTAM
jgi:Family of unknown function (DUF6882)